MKNLFQIIFVLLTIVFISGCTTTSPIVNDLPISVEPTSDLASEEIFEFEGVLTKFDSGCEVDRQCVAEVAGKKIITNPGNVRNIEVGEADVWKDSVGRKVKVRALRIDSNTYTLVGNDTLFVLLVE